MKSKLVFKKLLHDVCIAVLSGIIVGSAYFFFQNSNGFAPGGVGGLATITHHLLGKPADWGIFMLAFNIPIFILVSAFINKKLGFALCLYMLVQSFIPKLYSLCGLKAYCFANNGDDFNIVFACIATGVVSGFGFSLMLRHFGASGGTYGIAALIRRARPDLNLAYLSFIMDASVVAIAFFVYGMKVTPAMCTLINLFVANIIVDNGLSGIKNAYKFEIITDVPDKLAHEIMSTLKHGVTQINVHGVYSDSDKYMLVCIINKRQIGSMMRIIKKYPDSFANVVKTNEVFGNYKRKV